MGLPYFGAPQDELPYRPDIDATYHELKSSGANIAEPLEKKPWGLTQFTLEDLDGNRFYIHHD